MFGRATAFCSVTPRIDAILTRMVADNIRAVREHFERHRSVCPFAASAPVSYAKDSDSLLPLLEGLALGSAAVVVAEQSPTTFETVREWARQTFVVAMSAATHVSFPELEEQAGEAVIAELEAVLRDDSAPTRPMIGLRERALVTICMAPVYPLSHPRFAPEAALVLVHFEDVDGIDLPRVRQAMLAEHGSLYDALELMLPLPPTSREAPSASAV